MRREKQPQRAECGQPGAPAREQQQEAKNSRQQQKPFGLPVDGESGPEGEDEKRPVLRTEDLGEIPCREALEQRGVLATVDGSLRIQWSAAVELV